MLSEKKLCENEIYEICKSARDINLNECFRGVRILTPAIGSEHLLERTFACIGKIGSSERILLTDDKLCCFSVTDGWGEKDGYLFALNLGFVFNSEKPVGVKKLKEFIDNPPTSHGFISHMAMGCEIEKAKKILKALSQNQ